MPRATSTNLNCACSEDCSTSSRAAIWCWPTEAFALTCCWHCCWVAKSLAFYACITPAPATCANGPAFQLAEAKAKAPLAASLLVEEGSGATDAPGASLQPAPPALEDRTMVSRHQNLDGHGDIALQESANGRQRIGNVLDRL